MHVPVAVVCRILGMPQTHFYILKKHLGPDLIPVEKPRSGRGRTNYFYSLPALVTFLDRILPSPLSRDTIRRLMEQSEPLK